MVPFVVGFIIHHVNHAKEIATNRFGYLLLEMLLVDVQCQIGDPRSSDGSDQDDRERHPGILQNVAHF